MRSIIGRICFGGLLIICIALAFITDCRCARADSLPCPSQDGDPLIHIGFNVDFVYIEAGVVYSWGTRTYTIWPGNAETDWLPEGCKGRDTLCFDLTGYYPLEVWGEPFGTPHILDPGDAWMEEVGIYRAPCEAIGHWIPIIGTVAYSDASGNCRPECGDCNNPNTDANGTYFSSDTIWVRVEESQNEIIITQADLTFIEQGQPEAYLDFEFWNSNTCDPQRAYIYTATSKGHIGSAISQTDTIYLGEGYPSKQRVVMNATFAVACTYDTLSVEIHNLGETTIISASSDQVVHVIEPKAVSVFNIRAAVILTLALILAVAMFLRKRAVSVS